MICVKDPLREEAGEIIDGLHKLGVPKLVMMTGDSERTARSVAQTIGIDEYYSEVLPEDKANYILYSLLMLKRVSDALMRRIHRNYRRIIGFNLMLICLGVAGILPPATSALLHNASTLVISLESMTPLLKD